MHTIQAGLFLYIDAHAYKMFTSNHMDTCTLLVLAARPRHMDIYMYMKNAY